MMGEGKVFDVHKALVVTARIVGACLSRKSMSGKKSKKSNRATRKYKELIGGTAFENCRK